MLESSNVCHFLHNSLRGSNPHFRIFFPEISFCLPQIWAIQTMEKKPFLPRAWDEIWVQLSDTATDIWQAAVRHGSCWPPDRRAIGDNKVMPDGTIWDTILEIAGNILLLHTLKLTFRIAELYSQLNVNIYIYHWSVLDYDC